MPLRKGKEGRRGGGEEGRRGGGEEGRRGGGEEGRRGGGEERRRGGGEEERRGILYYVLNIDYIAVTKLTAAKPSSSMR